MEIIFRTSKLQKICSSESLSNRQWGNENARKVRQRLADLEAADVLADVSVLPPARCHELQGKRRGQFAVDLRHPFRLIFEPAQEPVPRKEDGGIDLQAVTKIRILDVEDYHGQ